MRCKIRNLALVFVVLTAGSAHGATVTLKNDTYSGTSAKLAVFTGLVAKEGFGNVLIPPSYPFKIYKVQVIIAGSSKKTTFKVRIYQDTPGSLNPGIKLFEDDVQVIPSTSAISEIDVSSKNLSISSGHIRVAFIQSHPGAPSIVRDAGPRKVKRNLIWGYDKTTTVYKWHWLDVADPFFIIPGNWIIRVVGETGSTTSDMTGPKTDGKTKADMGKAAGIEGGPCYPNGTCNKGLKCLSKVCVKMPDQGLKPDIIGTKPDTAGAKKDGAGKQPDGGKAPGSEGAACFPNKTCNAGLKCLSNLCVKDEGSGDSSGCAITGRGHQSLLLMLALVAVVLLIRRRKR